MVPELAITTWLHRKKTLGELHKDATHLRSLGWLDWQERPPKTGPILVTKLKWQTINVVMYPNRLKSDATRGLFWKPAMDIRPLKEALTAVAH